ncbi:MAG: hypothetical protein GY861_08615 [bacterium]|nr:hypothetical protein [bacterium]
MKGLTALELSFMLTELKALLGAKIDKAYQDKRTVFLQFHVPNTGKKILKITPDALLFTDDKTSSCPSFCTSLRKHLANARLQDIKQIGFERILELILSTKDGTFRLIIELFSKGNIILCNDDYKIIALLETQHWKTRDLSRGNTFKFPEPRPDFLKLSEAELASIIKKSDRHSAVKSVAMDLGLGGVYAEEACLLSTINKEKKPSELSSAELKKLCSVLISFKKKKYSPVLVLDGETGIDATPFKLSFYDDKTIKKAESFSAALSALPDEIPKENKNVAELKRIVAEQESTIKGLEKSIEENTAKAELIYENYALVKEIIEELNKARKKLSWDEIKAKLKNHKHIKQINEKNSMVTVEI